MFSKLVNCTKAKGLNYSTVEIIQNCAINYIQLTHKKTRDSHKKNSRTLDEMKKH